MRRKKLYILVIIALSIIFASAASGRTSYTPKPAKLYKIGSQVPYMSVSVHNAGKMALTITNYGLIGTQGQTIPDPITGLAAPSLSYPQGLGLEYL